MEQILQKEHSMLDPNELVQYIMFEVEQESQTEEMPEWLANFLADDDDYDIFSK
jgi:hypothetical protein